MPTSTILLHLMAVVYKIIGDKTTAYFRINTGKTLGKLHWKSKIPLQRNGMAVIQKLSNWDTLKMS